MPTPGVPAKDNTWTILANQRVTYSSLNQVTAESIYRIVAQLVARGWTVKGSCDGTAGAMDATNRWTNYTKAQTRFNGVAGAQSWFVFTDGNGWDIVFSYNGATDDRYNIWVAPKGDVTVHGTSNLYEPIAVSQIRLNAFFTATIPTVSGTSTSADRLVNVWTTANAKNFRACIFAGGSCQSMFGVEVIDPAAYAPGITIDPVVAHWLSCLGFNAVPNMAAALNTPSASAAGQYQWRQVCWRTNSGGYELSTVRAMTTIGMTSTNSSTPYQYVLQAQDLQGAGTYDMQRWGLYSITSASYGWIGRIMDQWHTVAHGTSVNDGDTIGSLEFIIPHRFTGVAWPWDGATAPVTA